MDAVGLCMARNAIRVAEIHVRDAIVAYEGVCEDEELGGVRGVCEGLRVTDHAGLEDGLTRCGDRVAEGSTWEDMAGGELKICGGALGGGGIGGLSHGGRGGVGGDAEGKGRERRRTVAMGRCILRAEIKMQVVGIRRAAFELGIA